MQEITIEDIEVSAELSALQGPATNALVHNPFSVSEVEVSAELSALQGPATNALVHNPFAFSA